MSGAPTPLPDGLEAMPPGPELAAVLASIGPATVAGRDTVTFLRAQYRQKAYQDAQVLRAMVEVGLAGSADSADRMNCPPEFAPDEIRAALVLTRTSATMQLALGWDLCNRLPDVLARLEAGLLDLPRARVLSEWTADLRPEAARAVVAAVLPRAHTLTTGALAAECKTLAIAVDPGFAERRYRTAITGRKVLARRNPDGSANLGVYDAPVDEVAAAAAFVQALAGAAKRAGHPGKIDHIRADLCLMLLAPQSRHLSDAELIAELFRRGRDEAAAAGEAGAGGGDAGRPGGPAPESGATHESSSAPNAEPRPQAEAEPPGGPEPAGPPPATPRGRGVEIRVRLSTMLGRDRYPGDMPGFIGPVHAELARHTVMANTGGPWRYVLCDQHGMLAKTGPLRARPTGTPRTGAGTVEIQVDVGLLRELASDPDQAGPWAPIVRELLNHAAAPPADHDGDRGKRLPGKGLRRFVYVRDRECVFPGCRIPAHHTDIDHSDDHAHGGETTEENLAPACRHDHRLKHEAGWVLEQPSPGHLRWTSRLGHVYDVKPKPVVPPLPNPMPPDHIPAFDRSGTDGPWNEHILEPEPEEEPQTPRPPPTDELATADDDEVPPF